MRQLTCNLSFLAIIELLYGLGFWLRWHEKIYQQMKDFDIAWFWLDLFKVQRTERNYVRFIRHSSLGAMVLCALSAVLLIVTFFYSNSN